jgi:pre-mRNA-processing factor SLU7
MRQSRWEEDVLINNHTSVWGSWWSDGRWGYACCHSLVKNSVCTGEAGKRAVDESTASAVPAEEGQQPKSLVAQKAEQEAAKTEVQRLEEARQKAVQKDAKLREALVEEDRRARRGDADEDGHDDDDDRGTTKKRKYHSFSAGSSEITDEQLEAYKLKRIHREDPMKDFLTEEDGNSSSSKR